MKSIASRFAMAAVCAAIVAQPASAATRFSEIVEAFSNLQPGAPGTVSNATFTIGHMKLTMRSGTASPVKAAGQTVAVFFKGDGTLDYDAAEPFEIPVVNHNVRQKSHLKSEGGAGGTHLSGPVSELMLYAAGAPLPAIQEGGSDVAAAFKEHQDDFGRERGPIPVAHAFLLQNLAAPSSKYVRAEVRSGRDLLVYSYADAETGNEDLYSLETPKTDDNTARKWLSPRLLSEQPIGRTRKATPPVPVALGAIDYVLTADEEHAKLDVVETLVRQSERQNAIRLDLDDLFFVRSGVPWRPWHLLSVTDAQGHSLQFDHKNTDLVIALDGVTGTTMKLTFSIEGDVLVRPAGDNAWQLGVRPWFPQPDLGGQFYTVHSVVRVKKPSIAFAPGKTVRRAEEGDYTVIENIIDKPVQFAVVHGGKYDYTEETRSGLTIRVASYAGKNERAAKQLTNLAYEIIDYYQWFLGPFPFDEFNIIQVPSWGFGQAPPATMFITNEAFDSVLGDLNKMVGAAGAGINQRFAHEIAHQYWGHVVKMPSGEEQWLTESFAEYCSALFVKKLKGDGAYQKMVNTWRDNAQQATADAPIFLANRLAGTEDARHRTYLVYDKGAYVLYTLHKELGDNPFLTFLKSYQKSFRWKYGSTETVAAFLQFMTKKDYTPFFDKYFWGTAMPD